MTPGRTGPIPIPRKSQGPAHGGPSQTHLVQFALQLLQLRALAGIQQQRHLNNPAQQAASDSLLHSWGLYHDGLTACITVTLILQLRWNGQDTGMQQIMAAV